jgi:hypothetical protein
MFSFFNRRRYAPLPTDVPSFPIPLPFVTLSGVDLGNKPVQNDVLNEFKKIGGHDAFVDVSNDIDRYINGANFAVMTPPQIEQHRNECWDRFQDTQLVPAINRMVPRDAAVGRLSSRQRACPSPADFRRQGINPLSHLEFFATNLYTKPGPFYHAVNRSLLQMEQNEVRINAKAYDDDKKTFNVWFYLFLSGLQKLIVPVPALFSSAPGNAETVRLYRGMPLDSDMSDSLWKRPDLWKKDEDLTQTVEDHKINYYSSLGFSSYTTSVIIACQFSEMNQQYTRKLPNVIVYEPRGGKISLPSLRFISDTAGEEEYLMFPNHDVMIFSREDGVLQSDILNERCMRSPTPINWIGMTDASDSRLREGIKPIKTRSGGTKRTRARRTRRVRARRTRRVRARRARAKRTRARRARGSSINKNKTNNNTT